jgi:hypothetical protein
MSETKMTQACQFDQWSPHYLHEIVPPLIQMLRGRVGGIHGEYFAL